MTSDTSYIWNEHYVVWVERSRNSYFYDASGSLTGEIYQVWGGSDWLDSIKTTYTRDGSGRILTELWQNWDDLVWVNTYQDLYTYDDIDNTVVRIVQSWNDTTDVWTNIMRTTETYEDRLLTTSTTDYWTGGEWEAGTQYTYTYNDSDQLTVTLSKLWSGSSWLNSSRITTTYTPAGLDTLDLYETYSGSWANFRKEQHKYDDMLNDVLDVVWEWNTGAWLKVYADTLKFDAGFLVGKAHYDVLVDSLDRKQYTYHPAEGYCTNMLHQYYGTSSWINIRKSIHDWQDLSTLDAEDEGITISRSFSLGQNRPNPFNPVTVIPYTLSRNSRVRIAVYNVLGQEVTTLVDDVRPAGAYGAVWNGTDRSGQAVASGIYFYRISAESAAETRKMVLLK